MENVFFVVCVQKNRRPISSWNAVAGGGSGRGCSLPNLGNGTTMRCWSWQTEENCWRPFRTAAVTSVTIPMPIPQKNRQKKSNYIYIYLYIYIHIVSTFVMYYVCFMLVLTPQMSQIMTHFSVDSRMSLTVAVENSRPLSGRFFQRGQRSIFLPGQLGHFCLKTSIDLQLEFLWCSNSIQFHFQIIGKSMKIIVKIMDYSSNSSEISWNSTFRQWNCTLFFKTSKVLPWLRGVWNRCICWNPWNWVSWPVHLIFTSRCLGRHYWLQRVPNSQRFFHLRSVIIIPFGTHHLT